MYIYVYVCVCVCVYIYIYAPLVAQTVKNRPAMDLNSIPGLGTFPGEGNDYPLLYSCLENSADRGSWWAIVHEVAKSQTQPSD